MPDCTCYYHAPELHSAGGCRMLGCACKWDGKLRPYRVEFGYQCQQHVDFATFGEALAFAKGFAAADSDRMGRSVRLINHTNIDGADDAKPWAQHGLTEAEWDEVQAVE